MIGKILIINAGSATLKFKIFSSEKVGLKEETRGIIERIGLSGAFLEIKENGGGLVRENFPAGLPDHALAFEQLILKLKKYLPEIKLVGHRVVHGGADFVQPTELNLLTLQHLKKFNRLAPLHNPINLACAEKSCQAIREARQFAVFDTAYYRTLPEYAYLYALPYDWAKENGIRRYGFHGISHEYAAVEGAKAAGLNLKKSKIITCHLGSGCSMTATEKGKAIETTMGFTPLTGLMMSTRSGDIDGMIPLFMLDQLKMSMAEADRMLNHQSGLLGIAGTMDMREILAVAGKKVVGYKSDKKFSDEEKKLAKLALKMFIYNIVRYVGQFHMAMKGLDLVVFTGGVGERSPVVREMILKEINFLAKFKTAVIEANEELMIARKILQIAKK